MVAFKRKGLSSGAYSGGGGQRRHMPPSPDFEGQLTPHPRILKEGMKKSEGKREEKGKR